MQFLRVKNWDEFQQYNDGRPIHWIKFHLSVLDDYTIDCLSETGQFHLFKIWLLAAKLGNKIPDDAKWIGKRIGAQSKVDINQLVTLGFLIPYETVRECTASDDTPYLEKRREEKISIGDIPNWIDPQLWAEFEQHRKEIRAKLTPTATTRLIANLDKYRSQGIDPNDAIRQSIENQWRGVFPERLLEKANARPRGSKTAVRETNDERRAREADEYRRTILAG